MNDDALLTIEIKNSIPVELVDLTTGLLSAADEYRRFLLREVGPMAADEVKLYVKRIKSGSIITDLMPYAPVALPVYEHAKNLIDFSSYLKTCMDFFIGKGTKEPQSLTNVNYQNISNLLEPIAKDKSAQMNVSNTVHGDMTLVFNISSTEANAAQNIIRKKVLELKEPKHGLKNQVLLYWYQARNDTASRAGDRAVIESIQPGSVKVVVEEHLKSKMLGIDDNPFKMAYLVDVEVETVHGRPVLYKVVNLHDQFCIDDDQCKLFESKD